MGFMIFNENYVAVYYCPVPVKQGLDGVVDSVLSDNG